jgi:hypothetical protein
MSRSDVDSAIDRPRGEQATGARHRPPVAVCAESACAGEAVQGSAVAPDMRSAALDAIVQTRLLMAQTLLTVTKRISDLCLGQATINFGLHQPAPVAAG